jgi:hypothetical protein
MKKKMRKKKTKKGERRGFNEICISNVLMLEK